MAANINIKKMAANIKTNKMAATTTMIMMMMLKGWKMNEMVMEEPYPSVLAKRPHVTIISVLSNKNFQNLFLELPELISIFITNISSFLTSH
jgi:hypothetical protein